MLLAATLSDKYRTFTERSLHASLRHKYILETAFPGSQGTCLFWHLRATRTVTYSKELSQVNRIFLPFFSPHKRKPA